MSSSDLFLFDDSFFRHFPDAFSSDIDLQFLSDPLYHFPDPSQQTPQSISNNAIPSHLLDSSPIPPSISYSPPNKKIQTLPLGSPTSAAAVPATAQGVADLGVKLEEFCMDIELENDQNSIPISLGMMQRSFSSQSLDRNPAFPFQPHFSSLLESPNFQTQIPNSAENKKIEGAMRRACSTGDLQQMPDTQSNYATSYTEEAGSLRVGRYSAEERKHRILRYRTKRNQRNFNKTIKVILLGWYACRKTLADSRPRVRGRFARNDEAGESIKAPGIHREEEDEEELWVINK
ncbi:hypothetical protein ACLOJK_004252 [Asimina triloba]